ILDGVTDPHNLGACLRSADAAGVHAVIVPKDRPAQLNAPAKKGAHGAAESRSPLSAITLASTTRGGLPRNIPTLSVSGSGRATKGRAEKRGGRGGGGGGG
ncbi:TrmH family RNA methyltransferase, partial [Escherichia coli]|uniref:TrmH family RNA methyltransferase n=1 Tax=Escherichia coli TaxID=562 RepID=UPI0025A201BD